MQCKQKSPPPKKKVKGQPEVKGQPKAKQVRQALKKKENKPKI